MLQVGQRVSVHRVMDDGFTRIAVGETGRITAKNYGVGLWPDQTWVTLDQHHPDLNEYGNAMCIEHDVMSPEKFLSAIPCQQRSRFVTRGFTSVFAACLVFKIVLVAGEWALGTDFDHIGYRHHGSENGGARVSATSALPNRANPEPQQIIKGSAEAAASPSHNALTIHDYLRTRMPLPGA